MAPRSTHTATQRRVPTRRAARGARLRAGLAALTVLAGAGVLAGCAGPTAPRVDPAQVDSAEVPELGACRHLTLPDISQTSDATPTVPCASEHTAQTYAVGELPDELADAAYDAPEVGAFAFETCTAQLERFLGGDASTTMRSIITWAWFRPSQEAWADGARWYRCDAVGGGGSSAALVTLPDTARGLLQGRPDDRWMACVEGASVGGAPTIPCSRPHDWRAVTTIKLGEPGDAYPGDRVVEVQTSDFCSESVGAWLNYPVNFDYGYTWFHQAEWDAGNRRSVCWAKTDA